MLYLLVHSLTMIAAGFNHDDFPLPVVETRSAEEVGSRSKRVPDCGVASVYCLLRSCDETVTVEDVEQKFMAMGTNVELSALSLRQLVAALEAYSVGSEAVRLSDAALDEIKLPAILYLHRTDRDGSEIPGHFIVLMNVSETKVKLIDLTLPLHIYDGIGEMDRARLGEYWKGDAVILRSSMTEKIESLITTPFVSALIWIFALTVVSWRIFRAYI